MGLVKSLNCPRCNWRAPSGRSFQCSSCGVVLEVTVAIEHLTRSHLLEIRKRADRTIWRWFEFFPIEDRSAIVSLGEGYTPLLRIKRLADEIGLARLYLKNDTVLPTGSLKDRSNAVGLSKAKELGFHTAAVISTGNAAASVAAYAAAAGLKSVVIVPAGTSPAKVIQAHAYGATVVVVKGNFEEAARIYKRAVQEYGWYDCLSSNPYRNEGKKSYAFELSDQLDEHVPHWVIHPTAGGTGLYAIWKGYNELMSLGWAHRLPRLVAAQSAAAAPIVNAWEKGLDHVEPVVSQDTVAESIRVGNPSTMGWRALEAIRGSNGMALALSDREILEAQSLLARLAGIFAEPAGAISVAAARRLRAQGTIGQGDLVVCNITGHGLKQPSAIQIPDEELRPIAPDLAALRERLQSGEHGLGG
ncbi:MAG: threonine synthase [Deltaproteobacteria bacterium GWA2_57_13]|nr:MAG: threonine synthase [Deltaproteobacteria bacterium GWA2_57_13]